MTKINRALLIVAASALPVQELAFLLPHRLEFPYAVILFCALVRVCLYALSSNMGEISQPKATLSEEPATALSPIEYITAVARELGKREFTVEDLKAVAREKGLTLAPLQYANILREFRKVGEIVSPNPASRGRKIGVFSN